MAELRCFRCCLWFVPTSPERCKLRSGSKLSLQCSSSCWTVGAAKNMRLTSVGGCFSTPKNHSWWFFYPLKTWDFEPSCRLRDSKSCSQAVVRSQSFAPWGQDTCDRSGDVWPFLKVHLLHGWGHEDSPLKQYPADAPAQRMCAAN